MRASRSTPWDCAGAHALSRHNINLIESPNRCVREITRKVSCRRDADMALCWGAVAFLEAEKGFRRIQSHAQLWILETVLRGPSADQSRKAA